jgi:tellurite resistance protein TerC
MIGGASWTWWIGFHVVVIVLLLVDALLPGTRHDSQRSQKVAWIWTGVLAVFAAAFAGWIAIEQGHVTALQFIAGYTIETSLSIDNLFVFLVLFEGFHVAPNRQHIALMWGIAGAVLLRALFIAAGVKLLDRFEWVTYIFGVFLLYAAWRLIRGGSTRNAIPDWIRRLHPAKDSLLPVIIAVEFTDLLFAVDSIPAVLAISKDPFVVYTSNIAAILGLRSLYFAMAGLLERLRYLHYGLGALLAFVAIKMLAAHWLEIPITWSLAIVGMILGICAVASMLAPVRQKGHGSAGTEKREEGKRAS